MIRYSSVIAALCACFIGGAATAEEAAPSGNAEAGKQMYRAFGCYQCHGTEAQGSPRTGPDLTIPIPYAVFIGALRAPLLEMPPYQSNVVTDQQVADIYAFIQTIPDSPDYKSIRLLQQ